MTRWKRSCSASMGRMLDGCDLEAVGRSIEADAADVTAILDEYPEPHVTYSTA